MCVRGCPHMMRDLFFPANNMFAETKWSVISKSTSFFSAEQQHDGIYWCEANLLCSACTQTAHCSTEFRAKFINWWRCALCLNHSLLSPSPACMCHYTVTYSSYLIGYAFKCQQHLKSEFEIYLNFDGSSFQRCAQLGVELCLVGCHHSPHRKTMNSNLFSF